MNIKVKTCIILFLFFSFHLMAGRYAGDFISIGTGVKSLGMGGAFSSVANDGSAIYWNCSGIAQMKKTELSMMRAFLYEGLAAYDNLSICQPLPSDVTIGVSFTRLTVEDIPIFSETHLNNTTFEQRISYKMYHLSGEPDGYFTSFDDLYQFAFAKHVHRDISLGWLFFDIPFDLYFGGSLKFIKRKLMDFQGEGNGFDISFLTKTSLGSIVDYEWLGEIAFGVNFQDIGGTTILWDTSTEHEDEILMNTKLGFSLRQPLESLKSSFILAFDKDYKYEKDQYLGFEFDYKNITSIRMGTSENKWNAGLSVYLYNFTLDYAFVTNVLGNTNRIGLKVDW